MTMYPRCKNLKIEIPESPKRRESWNESREASIVESLRASPTSPTSLNGGLMYNRIQKSLKVISQSRFLKNINSNRKVKINKEENNNFESLIVIGTKKQLCDRKSNRKSKKFI